ncbi:hypothetical protein Aab01nite_51190 [Paractinoplanes abujensis]|uniref:Heme exporter protein D n=1 Tax=Paractinoplanes abujensis TaxID=882441 RepID=A0A7W7CUR4_9ACTN|nr:hypothetical protein [Actinoplanes abujensis]MBB4693815.1 heme exporter protein D [Actinoplanes abujensis]GID21529.1 hypothetical protein Aab01nite_51190 [Actinoplanes abujensis]
MFKRPAGPSGLLRRLPAPAALVLAALCLLLPFMSASCSTDEPPRTQMRVTYTGSDVLTGGTPAIHYTDDAGRKPIHRLDDAEAEALLGPQPLSLPAQPVAWLAVALMLLALAATGLPSRLWRATSLGGLALAAAIVLFGSTVLARRDATDVVAGIFLRSGGSSTDPAPAVAEVRAWDSYDQVAATFRYGYGLWVAVAVLAVVGVAATVEALRSTPAEPAGPDIRSG